MSNADMNNGKPMTIPMENGSRGLRVVHIVRSLEVGGLERVVCDLARARRNAATSVLCLDHPGPWGEELRQHGVDVGVIGMERGKVATLWRLCAELRRRQPDVVHLHNLTALTFGAVAARCCGINACVFTKHGQSLPRRTLGDRLRQRLARRTHLVGVTRDVCDRLHRWCPCNTASSTFIPNGLNLAHWQNLPARDKARRQYGWSSASYIVGVVARLSDEKDHATLIRALHLLGPAHGEMQLAFAGEGPTRDSLESLCRDLGLRPRVHFLGTQHDVRPMLAACDLFVLPSHTEGTPVSLLEAMAAKLPCIGTRVGGIPDVIQHRRTGLLVPPRAERSLADMIHAVFDDRHSAAAIGQAARRHVEAEFSLHVVAQRYERLYESSASKLRPFHRVAG